MLFEKNSFRKAKTAKEIKFAEVNSADREQRGVNRARSPSGLISRTVRESSTAKPSICQVRARTNQGRARRRSTEFQNVPPRVRSIFSAHADFQSYQAKCPSVQPRPWRNQACAEEKSEVPETSGASAEDIVRALMNLAEVPEGSGASAVNTKARAEV